MQTFIEELRSTILPVYDDILDLCYRFLSRSLPPESLNALLSILLGLFKHVLVPSINPSEEPDAVNVDLLESTWIKTSKAISKLKDPVQHALADVWGQLLRRLRQPARIYMIQLMLKDEAAVRPEYLQNFLAFAFVATIKASPNSR